MLKRKLALTGDVDVQPHGRGSIFGSDPTRHQRRRLLFRTKDHNTPLWQPEKKGDMTELLEYILQHEEAFQK